VDPETLNTLRAAERAVARLVEACRKGGPLYAASPRAVAQVSRTGKWLLNALAALRPELRAAARPARRRG
jgi:hypothetical protein